MLNLNLLLILDTSPEVAGTSGKIPRTTGLTSSSEDNDDGNVFSLTQQPE